MPFLLSLLILSFWIGLPLSSLAQQTTYTVSGQVIDAISGKSLPFVHIFLKQAGYGVVTDMDGHYTLRSDRIPDVMVISCIGYETRQYDISFSTSAEVNISLEPKVTMLSEVTISEGKIELLYNDDHYSVLDYELQRDLIYLLIFRSRLSRAELLVVNMDGDTLCRKTDLPHDPVGLFKDCLDSIHVVMAHVAYQLFREGELLRLKYPVNHEEFKQIFGDCIASLHDYLYLRQYANDQLDIIYFGVNRYSREIRRMAYIRDEFKLNLIQKNPEDYVALTSGVIPGSSFIGDAEAGIPELSVYSSLRHQDAYLRFVRQAFYTPLKAPLKRIDENLAIFDFSNSKIRFFDPACNPIYEVPITFHHVDTDRNIFTGIFDTKEWKEYDIYVDEGRFKAYALFVNGGTYELKEIDLFSGNLTASHRLEFPFPEKISINEGYVYFMYKSLSDWTKKRLYRQKL